MMHEFRCTRPNVYSGDCPGKTDPTTRQGHYVFADDIPTAVAHMAEMFPDDFVFDIETNPQFCRQGGTAIRYYRDGTAA